MSSTEVRAFALAFTNWSVRPMAGRGSGSASHSTSVSRIASNAASSFTAATRFLRPLRRRAQRRQPASTCLFAAAEASPQAPAKAEA